jgi:hypothetical protein
MPHAGPSWPILILQKSRINVWHEIIIEQVPAKFFWMNREHPFPRFGDKLD